MRFAFGLVLAIASRFRQCLLAGFHFRPGSARMAVAAIVAALLSGSSAIANELQEITITSNPGSDDTYSSDGEDNIIVFEATWSGRVSVRGADLVFIMGDEEREAFCPQTGDCDTCPRFTFACEYEVQPGDLDEDGVSIPAASVRHPFKGSITRGNSNINQANCTDGTDDPCDYPGMTDNPKHKVDGGPAGTTGPEPTDQGAMDNDHTGRIASTLLAIGPPQIGMIDGADDVDYYRIDLAGNATLQVGTAGQTADTSGELLAGNGALIASDESTGPGENFRITETLAPGVYYVAVSGASGEYALSALLTDAADQGGTAESSALLTFYGETEVRTVKPSTLLSTTGRIEEAGTDFDFFRIDVPRAGMATVRSAGDTDTTGRVLDSSLMEVAMDDSEGNFQIETELDAGIYYVEVGGHEAGPYRVLASGTDPDCDCAEEAVTMMDHGGMAASSTLMPIGPPLTGEIADAEDMDVFRVDLAGSAEVVFETAGPTDTMGALRDAAGTEIASADTGGPAANFSITQELAAGTYYLEVSGAAGGYAVSALVVESDVGDTAGLSKLLPLYSSDDLANSTQALLSTGSEIDAANADVDVFRLDVPKDMTDVTIRSVGATNTFAYLRDASLMEMDMDDGDAGFRIETTLDAGVYYVEVGGHEEGRYRVLAWGDSREPCDCAGDADDGS